MRTAPFVSLGTALALSLASACCRRPLPPLGPDDARLVVVPAGAARPETRAAVAFAEVVSTRALREKGLMGRRRLEPDHGMLFVYPRTEPHRFWMKDCLIPLDIAFLREDGRIARLATLPPGAGLPADRIPEAESGAPVRYVLEMEAGWFRRSDVGEGDRVDVSAAADGVVAE